MCTLPLNGKMVIKLKGNFKASVALPLPSFKSHTVVGLSFPSFSCYKKKTKTIKRCNSNEGYFDQNIFRAMIHTLKCVTVKQQDAESDFTQENVH